MSGFKARKTNYEVKPDGTFDARIIKIIDLGTQTIKKKDGDIFDVRKVRIVFETPDNTKEYPSGVFPYTYHKDFINNLSGKSSELMNTIEAIYDRPLTVGEVDDFDFENLLDKACSVEVVAKTSGQTGNVYTIIEAVKKTDNIVPKATNDKLLWAMTQEDFDLLEFNNFHDTLKQEIQKSPEYAAMIAFRNQAQNTITQDEPVSADNLPDPVQAVNETMPDIDLNEIQTPF